MLVAVGETVAGIALRTGLFQRVGATIGAGVMLSILTFGGHGGAKLWGNGWSLTGYTDPGGDLMPALLFVVLVFAPTAYGVASRLRLRERWNGSSLRNRAPRFLVAWAEPRPGPVWGPSGPPDRAIPLSHLVSGPVGET